MQLRLGYVKRHISSSNNQTIHVHAFLPTNKVLKLTQEFAVDLGSFVFLLGKADPPSLVTINRCTPVKNTQTECSETSAYKIQTPGNYPEENIQQKYTGLKCSRVFFFGDIIRVISVFHVVRAVHKFDFRHVINKTPNKWQPVEKSCSDKD
jgi:hypothetical protein